jgi:hypothetical protein
MDDNFAIRIVVFFVVAAIVAIVDAVIVRPCCERIEVYGFLLGSGLGAGLFGAIFDQVTFTISSHYFVYLKEIEASTELELRIKIAVFGFAAALIPGLFASASMLVASLDPKSGNWKVRPLRLFAWYRIHIVTFLILVFPFVVAFLFFDPRGYRSQWEAILETNQIQRMIVSWSVHLAAYSSGVFGTILAIIGLLRTGKTAEQHG